MKKKRSQFGQHIAIYCRVSSQEQADSGKSLGNQEALLRNLIAQRYSDFACVVYAEVASARKTKRRRYQAMMRDIRAGLVCAVAAVEISRLWRNAADAISDIERFREAGCEMIIWAQGIDTTTAFGKLAFGLFALYAQFESDTVSERTKRAHSVAKAAGRRGPGRRPYGWRVQEDDSLVRDEHEQAGADLALSLRSQGMTWAQVADKVTAAGYLPVCGGSWDGGGLRLVLQSVVSRRAEEASRGGTPSSGDTAPA